MGLLFVGIFLFLVGVVVVMLSNDARANQLGRVVAVIGIIVLVIWLVLLLVNDDANAAVLAAKYWG